MMAIRLSERRAFRSLPLPEATNSKIQSILSIVVIKPCLALCKPVIIAMHIYFSAPYSALTATAFRLLGLGMEPNSEPCPLWPRFRPGKFNHP